MCALLNTLKYSLGQEAISLLLPPAMRTSVTPIKWHTFNNNNTVDTKFQCNVQEKTLFQCIWEFSAIREISGKNVCLLYFAVVFLRLTRWWRACQALNPLGPQSIRAWCLSLVLMSGVCCRIVKEHSKYVWVKICVCVCEWPFNELTTCERWIPAISPMRGFLTGEEGE